MQQQIISNIIEKKLIAIIRGFSAEECLALGRAIYAGGIDMIEVTFDQKSTDHFETSTKSILALKSEFGDRVIVGAGTVLTKEQVDLAQSAGAEYIVTPNTDIELIHYVKEMGLVSMPGALTPSEIENAYAAGADFVKVFPASKMGPDYISAIRAPLSQIPLLVVGGINEKNVGDYLKAGAVGAGIGGNLANKDWVHAGEFEKITNLAREYVKAVQR